MGIPRGTKRDVYLRKSPRWVPKKWKPIYDKMVLLQISGLNNKEIAQTLRYTEQQVANILNTNEAHNLRQKLSISVNEKVMETIDAKIKKITIRAVDNAEKVLFNDEVLDKSPLAMLDRSVNFLKAVGKLRGEVSDTKIHNTIVLGTDVQKTLLAGLEKANKVQEMHMIPAKTG